MHLSYGTNVHPAQDLPGVLAQLDRYAEPVRQRLGSDRLGLGLWLAADVSQGLATDRDALRTLRRELNARGLEVTTLTAFPYHGFHDAVVKRAVYWPSWTEAARLRFTANSATVLAALLPDEAAYGSISTLPLGWRHLWNAADSATAATALAEVVRRLRLLPRPIRLAVEPEPGCVLDNVHDAVWWLAHRVDPEYVGLCLDTCHLAVSFTDPRRALAENASAGLAVMKVQASAALQVPDPACVDAVDCDHVEVETYTWDVLSPRSGRSPMPSSSRGSPRSWVPRGNCWAAREHWSGCHDDAPGLAA